MANASNVLARERTALCDLWLQLGADAPTLCGDWTTKDLAAHLLVRETRPDSGPGILLGGPFADHTERVRSGAARRPLPELVDELRSGPPLYWPARWIPSIDVIEWFVHHEDVRRPTGLGPRDLEADLDDELWKLLGRLGPQLVRSLEVGVTMRTPDGRTKELRSRTPSVTLVGPVGELTLRLYGRSVAEVEVEGEADAIASFEAASLGI